MFVYQVNSVISNVCLFTKVTYPMFVCPIKVFIPMFVCPIKVFIPMFVCPLKVLISNVYQVKVVISNICISD